MEPRRGVKVVNGAKESDGSGLHGVGGFLLHGAQVYRGEGKLGWPG